MFVWMFYMFHTYVASVLSGCCLWPSVPAPPSGRACSTAIPKGYGEAQAHAFRRRSRYEALPKPIRHHLLPSVRAVLTCFFPSRVAVAVVTGSKNQPKRPKSTKQGAELPEENPQLSEHDDGLILFFLRWVL